MIFYQVSDTAIEQFEASVENIIRIIDIGFNNNNEHAWNLYSVLRKIDPYKLHAKRLSFAKQTKELSRSVFQLIREKREGLRGNMSTYYIIKNAINSNDSIVQQYVNIQHKKCGLCESFLDGRNQKIVNLSDIFGPTVSLIVKEIGREQKHEFPLFAVTSNALVCSACERAARFWPESKVEPVRVGSPIVAFVEEFDAYRVRYDGRIEPESPGKTESDVRISLFNLNRSDLVEKRRNVYDKVKSLLWLDASERDFAEFVRSVRELTADSATMAQAGRSAVRDFLTPLANPTDFYRCYYYLVAPHDDMKKEDYSQHDEVRKLIVGCKSTPSPSVPQKRGSSFAQPISTTSFVKSFRVNGYRGLTTTIDLGSVDEDIDIAILADNASGKTRLLQAISLSLMNDSDFKKVKDSLRNDRAPKDCGMIVEFFDNFKGAELCVDFDSEGNRSRKWNGEIFTQNIAFAAVSADRARAVGTATDDFRLQSLKSLFCRKERPSFASSLRPEGVSEDSNWDSVVPYWMETLFEHVAPLVDPGCDRVEFEMASPSINTYKGGAPSKQFVPEDMSDGLAATFYLAQMLALGLVADREPFGKSFTAGILLVDELDAHLHPAWRLVFRRALKAAFPNVQLIFTTHDPVILRGMKAANVFRLLPYDEERQQNEVRTLQDEADTLEGYAVDDLLISNLFGLDRLRTGDSEKRYTRYLALLAEESVKNIQRSESTKEEEEREVELNELKKEFRGGYAGYRHPRDRFLIPLLDDLFAEQHRECTSFSSVDAETKDLRKKILSLL